MRYKISDELFSEIVKNNFSIIECLRQMKLVGNGANYSTFHKRIRNLNISTLHFTGPAHGRGYSKKTISNDEMFIVNSNVSSSHVKNRIIKGDMLPYKCSECQIFEWRLKKLSLHLDHINGNNTDNRLENLRFLCPNCHSLTETYCGKNKRLKNIERGTALTPEQKKLQKKKLNFKNKCINCDSLVYRNSIRCFKCSVYVPKGFIAKRKNPIIHSDKIIDFLEALKSGMNYTQIGKHLNVSRVTAKNILNKAPDFNLCSREHLDELISRYCNRRY